MDLLIRAKRDDHLVLANLCAPAAAGLRSTRSLPLTGLVTDAHIAADQSAATAGDKSRPTLRAITEGSGLPFLIDPMTNLLQDVQPERDPWTRLPFANAQRLTPADLMDVAAQDRLVDQCLTFQRAHGATVLIPPYVYAGKLGGAWFEVGLGLLRRTEIYLRRHNIDLPVSPVLAASLYEFGPQAHWRDGIDRYLAIADELNLRHVAVSLSWNNPAKASYNMLALLMASARHISAKRTAIAWRQGLYGAALTAAGFNGYETGAGNNESCHYPTQTSRHRPKDKKSGGGGGASVYLPPFNRSVARPAARVLLEDAHLRGALICPAEHCCPDGATSMIDHWREHAIRARAREVQELAAMPAPSWRLNHVAREAQRSVATARHASELLREHEIKLSIPDGTFRALGRVADEMRIGPSSRVA